MKCGIVDVGSNTIRLSIYHWEGQRFKLLMNKKEMAGLAGYIQNGLLSDSGILVACRVLAGFKELLHNFEIADLRVFGTASLRNITNPEEARKPYGQSPASLWRYSPAQMRPRSPFWAPPWAAARRAAACWPT